MDLMDGRVLGCEIVWLPWTTLSVMIVEFLGVKCNQLLTKSSEGDQIDCP